MKLRVLTAVVAALAVTLVGCSGKATEGKAGEEGEGGIKTGPGVSSSTISLGVLTDMTGVYASLGKSVTQAQQLWVKQTNDEGGICDRKIELTVRDHGYDPQKAIAAYTELVPDVVGFAQFIGSPFVAAVEQRVDGQDKGWCCRRLVGESAGFPVHPGHRRHLRRRDDQPHRLPPRREAHREGRQDRSRVLRGRLRRERARRLEARGEGGRAHRRRAEDQADRQRHDGPGAPPSSRPGSRPWSSAPDPARPPRSSASPRPPASTSRSSATTRPSPLSC